MVRQKKIGVVDQIKKQVDASTIALVVDFRGINVTGITELRKKLRAENTSLNVYKNTLARRAVDELGIEYPSELLVGPSGLVSTEEEPMKSTKILVKFAKEYDDLQIKGGFFEKRFVSEEEIEKLSKLPGRDELIGQVVGLIKAPLTGLVLTLSNPVKSLVYALNAIKDKKKTGGEQ